jgi:murein DD-endopeptidase MepM/ murein hydrolase activator NlpD
MTGVAQKTTERPIFPINGLVTKIRGEVNIVRTGSKAPTDGIKSFEKRGPYIEIDAPYGFPVQASISGSVLDTGWNKFGTGMTITIMGIDKRIYIYGHLSRFLTISGNSIKQGSTIGRVGATGLTHRPNLYFAIKEQNKLVDPLVGLVFGPNL